MNSAPPSRNPANSSLSGGFREILGKFLRSSIDDMLPAKVIAYDRAKNRATVQPLIAMVDTSGNYIKRNQLANIPVFNIGGGEFLLSFNLKEGDLGHIKASDRDISEFLKNYKETTPSSKRAHDFNNGIFIPDAMTGWTIAEEDADNAVLQNLDGTVRVSLFPDKIKLTAPAIEVNSPESTFSGNVTIDGNTLIKGAASLGEGGQPIARVGDAVMVQTHVGPATGTITAGSGTHTAT
tara:strand:- start:2924 stop:3634 length:711 start_codon:yes stop_codon:yes gene_type:complete